MGREEIQSSYASYGSDDLKICVSLHTDLHTPELKRYVDEVIGDAHSKILSKVNQVRYRGVEFKYLTEFMKIFEGAPFSPIPNEYDFSENTSSWYIFHTEFGDFKIGRRKRVFHIEVFNIPKIPYSLDLKLNESTDFKDLNVTVGANFVHAWSLEDAKKYIDAIKKLIQNV